MARFYPGFTQKQLSMAEVFSSMAGYFFSVAALFFSGVELFSSVAALFARLAELFVRRARFFSRLAALGMRIAGRPLRASSSCGPHYPKNTRPDSPGCYPPRAFRGAGSQPRPIWRPPFLP